MRAVIICGGDIGSAERARTFVKKGDMIIYADSGYKYASALGVRPDIVLGDFDSYGIEKVECDNVKTYPARKDFTDSEIAAQYAIEQGADELIFLAATGGRADHALGNIYLLKTVCDSGVRGMIFDGISCIWYVNDKITVSGSKGDLLSVIPFAEAGDITTGGLEYVLENEMLPSTGISNVFTGDEASLEIGRGGAIVVYTPCELCE